MRFLPTGNRNRFKRLLAFLLVFQSFLIGFCNGCCAGSTCCVAGSKENCCDDGCCSPDVELANLFACCQSETEATPSFAENGGELSCCSCRFLPGDDVPAILTQNEFAEKIAKNSLIPTADGGFPKPEKGLANAGENRSRGWLSGNSRQSWLCVWRN